MEEASQVERPWNEGDRYDEDYDVRKVGVAGPAGETHHARDCAYQMIKSNDDKQKGDGLSVKFLTFLP